MVVDSGKPDLSTTEGPAPVKVDGITPTVSTLELLGAKRELFIDHRGEVYRLRITRNDKLILTK